MAPVIRPFTRTDASVTRWINPRMGVANAS